MDAIIKEIAPEESEEKVYLGYQFPIENPKILKKKSSSGKGEIQFKSSIKNELVKFILRVRVDETPKIEDILLAIVRSSTPE